MLHLLGVPASADAEEHAPPRDVVEARDLLGERDGVPLDDETDPRAELEGLRHGRRRAEGHERIQRVPVLPRQVWAAGPRALATGRDMGVLGQPHRFEAASFELAGELVGLDGVVRGEHGDAVLHELGLPGR
jgi:hypothetical protein